MPINGINWEDNKRICVIIVTECISYMHQFVKDYKEQMCVRHTYVDMNGHSFVVWRISIA